MEMIKKGVDANEALAKCTARTADSKRKTGAVQWIEPASSIIGGATMSVTFEGYERRIDKINGVLAK